MGEKIEVFEIKMALIAILTPPLAVLLGTAAAPLNGIPDGGPHGFSEVLYAFSS